METTRRYIKEDQARGYAIDRNIGEDNLPSLNHSISSAMSNIEEKITGFSNLNLGQDSKGYFISENISYRKFI